MGTTFIWTSASLWVCWSQFCIKVVRFSIPLTVTVLWSLFVFLGWDQKVIQIFFLIETPCLFLVTPSPKARGELWKNSEKLPISLEIFLFQNFLKNLNFFEIENIWQRLTNGVLFFFQLCKNTNLHWKRHVCVENGQIKHLFFSFGGD